MALRADIANLFPAWVVGQELSEPHEAEPLFPEEEACLANAVEKRRIEFALGRTAARHALRQLGEANVPLPPNRDRSVAWPATVWGSISHADGLCAAVVGPRARLRGIGIDIEVRRRVEPKLWSMVATEDERAELARIPDETTRLEHATVLFSAKEAFYKAQFCVSQSWVGFHDAEVRLLDARRFELRLVKEVGGHFARDATFSGRYALLERHVVTGLVIEPR